MKDWHSWHEAYDDATTSLARRLSVVQRRLAEIIDPGLTAEPRLLSLCAGDGRDLLPVLQARRPAVSALLVELDETLARRSRSAAADAGLEAVEVRCADAGDPASFRDFLPVGVLMLCGIFGNVEHASVKDIIDRVPSMLAVGGYVVWTRGESDPDRRPEVREWFTAVGLKEVSFDGSPEPYGVGVNQLQVGTTSLPGTLPDRLFTFV